MLIKALSDYYDILAESGKVLPAGYSRIGVQYLISLTQDGRVDGIVNWQNTVTTQNNKGKIKEQQVPREIIMFRRSEKPGICGNIVEHRPLYIFGLNFADGVLTAEDSTNKAVKSHRDFVQKNLEFMDGISSTIVDAYRSFIETWVPEAETENPLLLNLGKGYENLKFAFCLSGHPEILLHEDIGLKKKWDNLLGDESGNDKNTEKVQCGISGEMATPARIHAKIKGIPGGLATGNILVCFGNSSESSYGNEQAYNSNISESVMEKYSETLNMLISDKTHRTMLDDVTVVHWAMSPQNIYDELYDIFMTDDEKMNSEETDRMLTSLMTNAKNGIVAVNQDTGETIDPGVDFYIVGFKPNVSRLAVKFIYRKRFGDIIANIAKHREDMRMTSKSRAVPLWRIKKEMISPKAKNQTIDPALLTKMLESVIYGYNYPDFLLATMVKRVKTDSNTETNGYIKMNDVRVGIIKACINRKSRLSGQREEITLGLNLENTDRAYLCGRLFAVLEKLQQDASNNSLNRTIKDSYFASASTTPAMIFPKLVKLAQNHMGKAKYGGYWNSVMGDIMNQLEDKFPDTLTLTDQGKFIIGYYQQYFTAKETAKKQEEK